MTFFPVKRGMIALALLLLCSVLLFSPLRAALAGSTPLANTDTVAPASNETGDPALYIVQLSAPPLASYRGGIDGLAPTNPAALGQVKLDVNSPASQAYVAYLEEAQAAFLATVEATVKHEVEVRFTYQHAFNGMTIQLTPSEAAAVRQLDGVAQVQRDFVRYPQTDYGPQWIGADHIWDGTATGGLPGTRGENVVVGVIDTGINLDHPSFAEVGPSDGYVFQNPLGSGTYLGVCASNPGTYTCNDKLIGYYIFTGEGHEDEDGHGSHTASTAAGNFLEAGYVTLGTFPYSPAISGVAPHANIIAYDGCNDGGTCPGSALLSAINQTVADGVVDVINYSIGGGTSNPWTDSDALAFLAAQDAGLVPVTSAGNSGAAAGTIGSPADAPWMLSVGASTHNRAGLNAVVDMAGGNTTPPADIVGKGFSEGTGPAPIVYAGDYGDALCLTPFPSGTWLNDEIVVCDRGTIARVEKGYNVLQGGASGMVLANALPTETLNGDVHWLPAVQILYDDGVALKAWLDSGSNHIASISGTEISLDSDNGDIMAGFSSRGPLTNVAVDIVKPDVTAPGVDILAAYHSNPPEPASPTSEYAVVSGTSMSSPHTAGASALLRALHPDWTPAEIKSALMSTGVRATVRKEDGLAPADPFDMGAGRIDLTNAGRTGLVLDVDAGDFQAANPSQGGVPRSLNLASMGNATCAGACSWTRTVQSTLDSSQGWNVTLSLPNGMTGNVTPSAFVLPAGGSQTLTITVNVTGLPQNVWDFGGVELEPVDSDLPAVHMPIAVKPQAGAAQISVDPESFDVTQPSDTTTVEELTISNDGTSPLRWSIFESEATAPLGGWMDDFDSYATGSQIHGQGGWKGWFNDPNAGALVVDDEARSAPNSVEIVGASDLVHEYVGYSSGVWTYTAWQYLPANFSGESYFILLNQYDDSGATNNWSTQVRFNAALNQVTADGAGAGPSLPLIRDQWVEIRVVIDLDNDNQAFYYGDNLLYEASWTDGLSGGGRLNIAAVDLYANGASAVYYDDLSLTDDMGGGAACDTPSDLPWLSVDPDSGTTPAGQSSVVDVTFDSTDLTDGTYEGNLCVTSDAPDNPLVVVPVTFTVSGGVTAVQGSTFDATPATRLPLAALGLTLSAMAGLAVWHRRRR